MQYRDIIERMKSDGHYQEARDLERSVERTRGSTHMTVHGHMEAADGLSWCGYARTCAERAYDDIRAGEYRKQREQEEQEREQRRQEHEAAQRAESERQRQEEEAYWEHVQQQEQDAAEREQQEQEQPK